MQTPKFNRVLLSCLAAVPYTVSADQGWEGQSISLLLDNDAIASEDRHYTQGSVLRYWSGDDRLPHWLAVAEDRVPALGFESQARKWSLALGQEIYTPEDLRTADVIKDDRPYAGWLYGSAALQRRGAVDGKGWAMETFRLDVGVIGPESLAEETQKTWHSTDPAGWQHQLETEPGFVFRYDRRYLFRLNSSANRWHFDVLPHGVVAAGNVATHLGAGATFRGGYQVPNEFEAPGKATRYSWGAYLFTSLEGRLVYRNIFLDGNTFRSSHSVDKEPAVGEGKIGLAFVLKQFEITLAHHFRSPEFEDQKTPDSFGSVTITYKF